MPAATLRVWERRYAVARPHTSASGHRLYTALDVQRLALIKQLTEVGHAIGAIAALDLGALRDVAATHVGSGSARGMPLVPPLAPATATAPASDLRPWRVVVVGPALLRRLRRPGVADGLGRPLDCVAGFDAQPALASAPRAALGRIDALLVQVPTLQPDSVWQLRTAAQALGAARVAVWYGHAARSVSEPLAAAGVALMRAPLSDAALAQSLRELCGPAPAPAPLDASAASPLLAALGPIAQRRYDDATLADVAALSTTLGCECPRHVAELLMQLSSFETYSIECTRLSAADPRDAALHAALRQVAGASRALFETALEQVALHEGLVLPA